MRLDVLIPTLNRAPRLELAVRSLLAAPAPAGLDVVITVIDNNCTDETAAVVERLARESGGRVRRIVEHRRGKSRALNTGISASSADLIGMIDDDEEVDVSWFEEIAEAFRDPTLDFIGGPYVPKWDCTPPAWVPKEYLAVVGAADGGPDERPYGPDFPGILKGGNAVVRRELLMRLGGFAEHLGPTEDARLLSCEDEEMYFRIIKAGARGRYRPGLVIYHHVAAERLTPQYYRRWCFWRGVSRGLMDRSHPVPVPYLGGVPRYLYGRAARGLVRLGSRAVRGEPWERSFSDELSVWDLAGFWWGRHIYTLARFSPLKSRRRPGAPSAVTD
jgi:glycosyltransferase involved in cell wall biosynthesis